MVGDRLRLRRNRPGRTGDSCRSPEFVSTRRRREERSYSGPAVGYLATCLTFCAIAAAILAGRGAASTDIVGGSPIQIQAAPWSVYVEQDDGSSRTICSGSIIDAEHVVTAAHCVYGVSGQVTTPSTMSVIAGISNVVAPAPTDLEQTSMVSAFRVEPGFMYSLPRSPDDIAVLTLSTPLNLSGPAVQAVALPAAGMPFPARAPVGVAGFGRQIAGLLPSGALVYMTAIVDPQGICGDQSSGLIDDDAVILCAYSATSATCHGDSGAGLVTATGTPTLIGVADTSTCDEGSDGSYAYVGAPEILTFVEGDDQPPVAPRDTAATTVEIDWERPLVVGSTLTCSTRGWSGPVQLSFAFVNLATGQLLQSGTGMKFTVPARFVGSNIACQAIATNAGGSTVIETQPAPAVADAPALRLSPAHAVTGRRGRDVTLRVLLDAPAGLHGKFAVCAALARPLGLHLCRSKDEPSGVSSPVPLALRFRLRPNAPLGTTRIEITAVAGVSTATASTLLHVNP